MLVGVANTDPENNKERPENKSYRERAKQWASWNAGQVEIPMEVNQSPPLHKDNSYPLLPKVAKPQRIPTQTSYRSNPHTHLTATRHQQKTPPHNKDSPRPEKCPKTQTTPTQHANNQRPRVALIMDSNGRDISAELRRPIYARENWTFC